MDWQTLKTRFQAIGKLSFILKLKHIYLTLIEKQALTTYTNLSRFWEVHQYSRQMCGPMKIQKLTPIPGIRTRELEIARPMLYLMTMDTAQYFIYLQNVRLSFSA